MRAAFSTWDQRIAPVFDVAETVHIIDTDAAEAARGSPESLPEEAPIQRALRLVELGVETLVCGAISRPVQDTVASYGIRVIPFVAGDLAEVIQAWRSGQLQTDAFAMPGCGRGRGGRGGGKRGRGMGRGQRHRRGGGRADADAQDSPGLCICPQCGHREPLGTGAACARKPCPRCGAAMVPNRGPHRTQ